jgi:SAM-dependent methyltransferase
MGDWARDYFERGYAQRWGLPPPSEQIRQEVSGLWEQLRLTPRSRILDVGCGHGRHAVAIEQLGPTVVGLDSATTLLSRPKRLSTELDVHPHWVQGDMRRLPFRPGTFDAAILIDAFGFFDSDAEDDAALGEIADTLSPGGRLGFKIINGAFIAANFRPHDREERDGIRVQITRTLTHSPARLTEMITVSDGSGTSEYERRQRLYHMEEIGAGRVRAGLSIVAGHGSAWGAFDSASPTLWIIGENPRRI